MNIQTPFPLWPDGTPGLAPGVAAPTLTPFLRSPDTGTGGTFIVCPGGGYGGLADHEGAPVARWLNAHGVAAFLLHYRLGPASHHPDMLHDAARAVRTVRARAGDWGVDPSRIGILGFSAGGHLASTLATHFDLGDPQSEDPVERVSSRPDAAVLVYPVITLQEPWAHLGSRTNLLGETPDPELVALLSNHLHVSPQTPPTFLVHSADDGPVPPENSLLMASALSAAGVPFALHLYERGGHGYGLAPEDPVLRTWPDHCAQWLRGLGF